MWDVCLWDGDRDLFWSADVIISQSQSNSSPEPKPELDPDSDLETRSNPETALVNQSSDTCKHTLVYRRHTERKAPTLKPVSKQAQAANPHCLIQ